MARYIGIRHRIKQSAEGEARPTQIFIINGDKANAYDLADDTTELDWALGRFPIQMRPVTPEDNLGDFRPHHIVWRVLKLGEEAQQHLLRPIKKEDRKKKTDEFEVAIRVPAGFDGLRYEDKVAMVLGGSGDRFAFALSRQAEQEGAEVWRTPPFTLKELRQNNKDEDAQTLAELLRDHPDAFQLTGPRDRELIRLRETLRSRTEAMKARMGCDLRLRQSLVGSIFCDPAGLYPEGSIEQLYDSHKANSRIMQALCEEEGDREKELVKIVKSLDIYEQIFEPIMGIGPLIAARLIAAIGDIRRFESDSKLKAFCGVHVMPDGRFVRRRGKEVANWHPDARQALYLVGDQFNRRPKSDWGKMLLAYKAKFRQKYPEPVQIEMPAGDNGKTKKVWRYNDGHIHRRATWRTITKFVEWLFKAWWAVERAAERAEKEIILPEIYILGRPVSEYGDASAADDTGESVAEAAG